MSDRNYILTQNQVSQKLQRLALEVAEQLNGDDAELIIIGIRHGGGVTIAQKISELVRPYVHMPIVVIEAEMNKDMPDDIVFSRDIDFNGKNVLITDDVSNSGKVLMYVLKPLLDFHPKRVQTLVLVERMHKLFPVKPDYVGLSLATTLQDHILVEVKGDEIIGAFLI